MGDRIILQVKKHTSMVEGKVIVESMITESTNKVFRVGVSTHMITVTDADNWEKDVLRNNGLNVIQFVETAIVEV